MSSDNDDLKNKPVVFMNPDIFPGSFDPSCSLYAERLPDGRMYIFDKTTKSELFLSMQDAIEMARQVKKLLDAMPVH